MSQEKPNGADLSVAASVPSTRSSTLATPTLSEALTEMDTLPETVAPPLGAANATAGSIVSAGAVVVVVCAAVVVVVPPPSSWAEGSTKPPKSVVQYVPNFEPGDRVHRDADDLEIGVST